MSTKYCPICEIQLFAPYRDALLDYEYRTPYCVDLIRCEGCGLVRQREVPGYDRLGLFYPSDYLAHNANFASKNNPLFAFLKRVLYSRKANAVARLIGRKGRVLDVGCANGAFLQHLNALGNFDLHGLDIKDPGIDFAAKSISFHRGPLETAQYAEGFFDAVNMDNVIEHVPDPIRFLNDVRLLLKPGGYVFGSTPNHNSWDRGLFGKYWGGYHMPRHIYLFNACNFELLLEKTGFRRVCYPVTANAADWAVSLQNFLQRKKVKTRPYTRTLYFPLVGMAMAPLAIMASFLRRNGVMDFIARKA